jgi:transposase
VKDFINRQLEISDKLFKVMFEDHKERIRDITMWAELDASLIKKLDERDAEIRRLNAEIVKLKADAK